MYRAFRDNVANPSGTGRTRLEAWPEILMGIVNQHRQEKRVVHVTREMRQGVREQAVAIIKVTAGGEGSNMAFLEGFNATLRER